MKYCFAGIFLFLTGILWGQLPEEGFIFPPSTFPGLRVGTLISQKPLVFRYEAESTERLSIEVAGGLEGFTNPRMGRIGVTYPFAHRVKFRYDKNQNLRGAEHSYHLVGFHTTYYYHPDLHHAVRFFVNLDRSWLFQTHFFVQLGGSLIYQLNVLPSSAFEIDDNLTSVTKYTQPVTHHSGLGFHVQIGREFIRNQLRIRFFVRSDVSIINYNIGVAPLYGLDLGFNILLWRKK